MVKPDDNERGYPPRKQFWGGNPLMWIISILAIILIGALVIYSLSTGNAVQQ